jgi:23S rRNA pseudouridine2605 synthase
MANSGERLHKTMARAGIASRRASEKIIASGKVTVNGSVTTAPGTIVDPEKDIIEVDGKRLSIAPLVYYLVHKPVGYISTAQDEKGRPSVVDLVPRSPRVYPVGRLDRDTSGLILLTNDGRLAYALAHPKFRVSKTYVAWLCGDAGAGLSAALLQGVALDDGAARADDVEIMEKGPPACVRVRVHEGRNRLVRRIFSALGREVKELFREELGPISLGRLAAGSYRRLRAQEVDSLYRHTGLSSNGPSGGS